MIFNDYEKSLMEILKVNNKEVPFANILAYYLDINRNNELGNLFLKALTQTQSYSWEKENWSLGSSCLIFPEYDADSEISIITEQKTINNKRIDILIKTSPFDIAIEFKINHELNNPLDEYIDFVCDKGNNKKYKFFFILSSGKKEPTKEALKHLGKDNENQFRLIVLRHYFVKIREIFNKEYKHLDVKKLQHFDDLVRTVNNNYRNYIFKNILEELRGKGFKDNSYYRRKSDDFIEIKQSDYTIKLRVNQKGWQFEKWIDNKRDENLSESISKENQKTVSEITEKLIEFSQKSI